MDDKEFKQRLSEVAEWLIPKTPAKVSKAGKKKRKEKLDDEHIELDEDNVDEDFFKDGINPTYPPMLTKVKRCGSNCEDCGDYCPNGREKTLKIYETKNKRGWKQKCLTCNRYQNPYNNKFELTGQAAFTKWAEYIRQHKDTEQAKNITLITKKNQPQ